MKRKLIAALACRAGGSRLYGKPLQNLEGGRTILGHILECIEEVAEIAEPVLGISEGTENLPFVEIAQAHGDDRPLGRVAVELHPLVGLHVLPVVRSHGDTSQGLDRGFLDTRWEGAIPVPPNPRIPYHSGEETP